MKKKFLVLLMIMCCVMVCACGKDKDSKSDNTVTLDYGDETAFEKALNNGENLTDKTVKFTVKDFAPDSAFGYNLMAGDHLNFVSPSHPNAAVGDVVTVKATSIESFMGSWIVYYDKIENAVENENTIKSN